jgi:pimeloyl-ACP methyl ester carboxylesterase
VTGPGPEAAGGRRTLSVSPVGGLQAVGALQVQWRGVAVPGGSLAVAAWGDPATAPEVVVGVHGLTGNALVWAGVAGLLDGDPPLVAPDLRGRGRSRDLPGPHGLRAHVDDLVAVLDSLGRERVTLVGHGLGAHVATLLAERHPERVTRTVLVDPDAVAPPDLLTRVTAVARSREEHRAAWREEAALTDTWNRLVEGVVEHDAVGEAPAVRRAVSPEAVAADLRDLAQVPRLAGSATGALVVPGEAAPAGAGVIAVGGASHWTLLLGLRGADAVSRALLAG